MSWSQDKIDSYTAAIDEDEIIEGLKCLGLLQTGDIEEKRQKLNARLGGSEELEFKAIKGDDEANKQAIREGLLGDYLQHPTELEAAKLANVNTGRRDKKTASNPDLQESASESESGNEEETNGDMKEMIKNPLVEIQGPGGVKFKIPTDVYDMMIAKLTKR